MPPSRSPNHRAKSAPAAPAASTRLIWPLVLIGAAAVLAVVIAVLPASMLTRFLPPSIHAEDFSGNLWHGSAGKISVDAHDAGALEWRLHPLALLGLGISADLHWVRGSFVVDAAVDVSRHGFIAHAVKGGGSVEELRELGVAPGWRGSANIDFSELSFDSDKPLAAVGELQVSNLSSAGIAGGVDLGGYALKLLQGAVGADGNVAAQLTDTGGPLELQALIHFAVKEHTGLLSGALRERAEAPAALVSELQSIAQVRGRDPQGRIPLDLEFSF